MTLSDEAVAQLVTSITGQAFVSPATIRDTKRALEASGLVDQSEQIKALEGRLATAREALEFYASSCDATETTPCTYAGQLCCKTACAALDAIKEKNGE